MYKKIFNNISKSTNLPIEVVETAYKSYWEYVRETIQNLPLKDDLNEEEFSKLRTNFNIPSLGKLTCTLDRYKGIKKHFKYKNNDNNKEN